MTKLQKYLLIAICIPLNLAAAPMGDFSFKSPAFNGIGYSSHVLTIENQEFSRQKSARDAIQAAIEKAAADKKNTNLQKFLNNLESRIYAQISQNLATAMFKDGGTTSGTLNFEGNTIFWTKDGTTSVTLVITDTVGNQTTIVVPLGSFQF